MTVIVLVAVLGGKPDTAPSPTPSPSPSPSPSPTPLAPDVHGEITTEVLLADPGAVVGQKAPLEPRAERIDQFVEQIRAALDTHLTSLGQGGTGILGRMRAEGMPGIDPELSAELASPERWVVTAAYAARVGHAADPLWAEVTLQLERSDGSTATPTLVFVPGTELAPRLVAWQATIEDPDLPSPSPGATPPPGSTPSPASTTTPAGAG